MDYSTIIHDFLSPLDNNSKQELLNILLGVQSTHRSIHAFRAYSCRNIALFKAATDDVRTITFSNQEKAKLVIRQFKKRSFLKSSYHLDVSINGKSYDYSLIEEFLSELTDCCCEKFLTYA